MITNLDGTPSTYVSPINRPMEKMATPEEIKSKNQSKKGRKRTGLFIGMIVSLFVAIACGMAALLIFLNTPKTDMVAAAVNRLVNGDTPENVMVDGVINLKAKKSTLPFSSLKVSIGTEAVIKSKINSTAAKLDVSMREGEDFSINVYEIYGANGDLYLKVDGLNSLLNNTDFLSGVESAKESLKYVDSEWIRIPVNNLQTVLGLDGNQDFSCLTNILNDIDNNSNSLTGMYLKNPFIGSTNENLTIESERDPIYKITINQNLQAFANEAASTSAAKSLVGCLGRQNSTDVTGELVKIIQDLPDVYAEVDDNANFTRLYFETETGDVKMQADFRFSYPININVPEPTEYLESSEITQKLSGETKEGEEPREKSNAEEVETGVDPEIKQELQRRTRGESEMTVEQAEE